MTDAAPPSADGSGSSAAESVPDDGAGGTPTEASGEGAYRERLRSIFNNEETPWREKITAALHLGRDRFEVDNAHLVRIDPADGTRTVVKAIGTHPKITEGIDTVLAGSYCRETIVRQAPLTILNAEEEGWKTDPAYQMYEFSTYFGAKVRAGDGLYGTVCFADEAASDGATTVDTDFLEQLADEIGGVIERHHPPASGGSVESPESLLRRIQEVAEVGAWVYDAETDSVTGSDELYRLLELPEGKELDLETALSFFPPDARRQVESGVRDCLADGSSFDLTVPLVTMKGTRRWVRARGHRHRREDGTFQLTGTLQDVSDQKQIENTLQEERKVLRRMYRITADRTASFGEKVGRLIDLGRDYLDLPYGFITRITEGTQRIVEAQGSHPKLQAGASCPLSKSYCRKTIQEDSLLAVQNALADDWAGDPAFETFGLGAYIGAKILVDEELYGTFCFAAHEARETAFHDRERTFVELLTRWASYELEQKQAAEKLAQQNERLDRLTSVVSHDLRNPLNVAQGRLELIQEQLGRGKGGPSNETSEHIEAVHRAHVRIDMIIEDMMALTRSGQLLDAEDLEQLSLRDIAQSSWSQVQTEEATLRVEGEGAIRADEGRLRQLLENLFRNAIDHGGASVTVRVGPLPDGFYVEDDGTGIPEAERAKVFEASYTTSEDGTGLGLSIAQTVAEAHGWSIAVTSGEDGGARFEITDVDGSQ